MPGQFETAGTATVELTDIERILDEIESERIKLEDFRGTGIVPDEEIDRDLERCRAKEGQIAETNRNISAERREQLEHGHEAEYTLRHCIQDFGWLAPEVHVLITSQFDDYFYGVDSVAQIILDPEHFENLGLAVDFASSQAEVGAKLQKTFESLDQGYATSIKYFDSDVTGKATGVRVPRLVIGAGSGAITRMANYCSEIMSGSGMAEKSRQAITQDAFRYVLYGEILAQLGTFCDRLNKVIAQARAQRRHEISTRAEDSGHI